MSANQADSDDEYLKRQRWSCLDLSRSQRTGTPEVVLAEAKTEAQLQEAVLGLLAGCGRAMVTRLKKERVKALSASLPFDTEWRYDEAARFGTATAPGFKLPVTRGKVAILTAGTSDHPVAREAQLTAEALGCRTRMALDCGVAGLHRLREPLEELLDWDARVVIVAAGREGALPTVVAGLIDRPVFGLPVSTGYGLGGRGEAALYGMLQSCTPLLVVNIDAGFVAGATAAQIAETVVGNHGR